MYLCVSMHVGEQRGSCVHTCVGKRNEHIVCFVCLQTVCLSLCCCNTVR